SPAKSSVWSLTNRLIFIHLERAALKCELFELTHHAHATARGVGHRGRKVCARRRNRSTSLSRIAPLHRKGVVDSLSSNGVRKKRLPDQNRFTDGTRTLH